MCFSYTCFFFCQLSFLYSPWHNPEDYSETDPAHSANSPGHPLGAWRISRCNVAHCPEIRAHRHSRWRRSDAWRTCWNEVGIKKGGGRGTPLLTCMRRKWERYMSSIISLMAPSRRRFCCSTIRFCCKIHTNLVKYRYRDIYCLNQDGFVEDYDCDPFDWLQ